MIRNKAELLQASDAWMRVASKDLQKHLKAFVEAIQRAKRIELPLDTVAKMFDVDPRLISDVYYGRATDVPLSFFAKLLIASNHAIQIVPVEKSPLPHMGGHMPPIGTRPAPCPRPTYPTEPLTEPRQYGERPQGVRPAPRPRPTWDGADLNPVGVRPVERVFDPATGVFRPAQLTPARVAPAPYPMPNPDGMLPPPEVLMEQAREAAMRDRAVEEEERNPAPLPQEEDNHTFQTPSYGYSPFEGGEEEDDFDPMDEIGDDVADEVDSFDEEEDYIPSILGENIPVTPPRMYGAAEGEAEAPCPENVQTTQEDDVMALARELRNNPELANILRRFI